jgi:hypothetical protein
MSRTFHHGERRRIRVKGIRREHPDTRLMARALIEYARAEQEEQSQPPHTRSRRQPGKPHHQPKDTPAKGSRDNA